MIGEIVCKISETGSEKTLSFPILFLRSLGLGEGSSKGLKERSMWQRTSHSQQGTESSYLNVRCNKTLC